MQSTNTTESGFTLLEMLIVVALITSLASVGVPMYRQALRTARIAKAKQELQVMSRDIDVHRARHDGDAPFGLAEVGHAGRLDPWGTPYCYLNIQTGSGDGMEWAFEAGLVDTSAVGGEAEEEEESGGGLGGLLGGITETVTDTVTDTLDGPTPRLAKVADATTNRLLGLFSYQVSPQRYVAEDQDEVADFVEPIRRKDSFLFPLNTDYDLFSLGPNRRTAAQISQRVALDDVIRANDGGFFGTASDY